MRTILGVLCLTLCAAIGASQTTINVPGDQPTIQDAIIAASPGDTVLVAPGTYAETSGISIATTGGIDTH